MTHVGWHIINPTQADVNPPHHLLLRHYRSVTFIQMRQKGKSALLYAVKGRSLMFQS